MPSRPISLNIPGSAAGRAADELEAAIEKKRKQLAGLKRNSWTRRRQLESQLSDLEAVALELRRAADEFVAEWVARVTS